LHVTAIMHTRRPRQEPTTLEVMDHVLGKGIGVARERDADAAGRRRAVDGLGLLGISAHVEIVAAPDGTPKNPPGA
jgi:hypothetical protein